MNNLIKHIIYSAAAVASAAACLTGCGSDTYKGKLGPMPLRTNDLDTLTWAYSASSFGYRSEDPVGEINDCDKMAVAQLSFSGALQHSSELKNGLSMPREGYLHSSIPDGIYRARKLEDFVTAVGHEEAASNSRSSGNSIKDYVTDAVSHTKTALFYYNQLISDKKAIPSVKDAAQRRMYDIDLRLSLLCAADGEIINLGKYKIQVIENKEHYGGFGSEVHIESDIRYMLFGPEGLVSEGNVNTGKKDSQFTLRSLAKQGRVLSRPSELFSIESGR
jgi:hypothetical protein